MAKGKKHTSNISAVKVRAQKTPKQNYLLMYKLDNNTYQRGREKGRRWVKSDSVGKKHPNPSNTSRML